MQNDYDASRARAIRRARRRIISRRVAKNLIVIVHRLFLVAVQITDAQLLRLE